MILKTLAIVMLTATFLPAAELENLGQPCRAFNVLAGRIVADSAGREWLVLSNMNELTGAELIFIDPKTNEGKTFRAPAGQGAWALNPVSGNRLIVGTFYDGQFMVFDVNQMKFVKNVGFPGETYIWTFALGGDGRIYGGTYPNGKLGALNLNTYQVEDLGAPAPPNLYLRNTSPTHDGRILCNFVTEKPTQMLFDPKTKKFEPLPKSIEGVQTGVEWNGYFIAGGNWDSKGDSKVRAFNGANFDPVDPLPFPMPKGDKWGVDIYVTTHETLYVRQGESIFRFRAGENELTQIAKSFKGRFLGETKSGDVLGVRGQDYTLLRTGEQQKLMPIPVEGSPRVTHFLRADDNGRVWGGPTFGQTVFHLDVATKKFTNTSQVTEAGGEVYDVAFARGKVFMVAYAGGNIIEYDPAQEWDQQGNTNPRTFASLGARGYIRPIAGVTVAADGKIFAGWMASYGKYGGAVSITDEKGETDLIENPVGEQAISGLAVDGKNIYIGTNLDANGLPAKQGEPAHFAMIDRSTRKVSFKQPFENVPGVNHVLHDAKTNLVTLVTSGKLQLFDPATQKLTSEFTPEIPAITSHSLVGIGDGKIYFGSENSLFALDLQSHQATKLVDATAKIDSVAISPNGALFIACGADVFAVK